MCAKVCQRLVCIKQDDLSSETGSVGNVAMFWCRIHQNMATLPTDRVCWQCCNVAMFWCRIHLWFRLIGGLQAKSMTSQRYQAVTRWRICVTMATLWQQQDDGYALLFYIFNSTVIGWTFLSDIHCDSKNPGVDFWNLATSSKYRYFWVSSLKKLTIWRLTATMWVAPHS